MLAAVRGRQRARAALLSADRSKTCHLHRWPRGFASASTPAAPSPTSCRSIPSPARPRSPRSRARRPIRAIGAVARRQRHSGRRRRHQRQRGGPRPWHHGRDQRAAAGRDQFAGPDRQCGFSAHPRDRPAVGAGGLRKLLFLGQAGPHRAAAIRPRSRRPAGFPRRRSCARSTRRACARPRDIFAPHGIARDRHLPVAFLCQ